MNIRISKPLCFSELGKKPNQEDALFPHLGQATPGSRVLLVCDGMGGHEHGEVASTCVADTIGWLLSAVPFGTTTEMQRHFEQALAKAYQELDKLDDSPATARKMGTTLTFWAMCTDGILIAHIGDSRVYQLRRGEGVVFQTHDHSLLNELIAAGELDEEGVRNFNQKNVITRAVQPHQEYPAKATYKVITDIRQGDLFFLCCDGIVEQLDNNDLIAILLTQEPLQERLDILKKTCAQRGTRDNHSCYAVEIESVRGIVMADPPTQSQSEVTRLKPSRRIGWLWWLIAGIACLTVLFLWMGKTHDSASDEERQPNEQNSVIQGTIQRNK